MNKGQISYQTVIRLISYSLLLSFLLFWVSFYQYPGLADYMKTNGTIVYLFTTVILALWLDGYIDGKPRESANRLLFFTLFAGSTIMSRIIYDRMDGGDHEILLVITASLPYMIYTFYLLRKFVAFLTRKTGQELGSIWNVLFVGRIFYAIVMGTAFLLGYGTHVLLLEVWGNPV
ncbi:hypothetical protein D3P07_09085 [Paenibacillus sp. 1011MAR3C5]|uniref:hypothetical protein n=1 Tax=Paenibacillus sp. 1011MAR3C5 TaxID=1675787 RepID=UPI000E6D2D6F|nr:hypothetical protein [Paenibacillus sp. 1011MAR3C5]RJE90344.1 hypothetical protein D3P07_09085 [Paenibacillus sp. 1011MAR3C5]